MMTFVLSSWGNAGPVVGVELVAAVRASVP